MPKRFARLSFIVTVITLLLLSGCSGANNANSSASGSKTLTVAQVADAVTLDPHGTNDRSSANPMKQIYNTLVNLTPDMKVVPGLAESWKQLNDVTWEFILRKGVKFHNGEELKASDVKFTYDRLLDPKKASPAAFLLAPVSEVKVVDDYTVDIISKEPFAPLVYNLTHVGTSILNEKAVKEEGDQYGQHPVGTGPFKFVSWDKSSKITMEKFKDYYEGAAKYDKLVFRIIPESATAIAELRTGGIDVLIDLPSQQISQFKNSKDVNVVQDPSFMVKYLGFDVRQKPFDNKLVRQAINYATNKEEIVKAAYQNTAVPAVSTLAPGLNGYNKNLKGYEYNPKKAKELLAQAGYPNGFSSTIYTDNADIDTKLTTILQSQLKQVGIDVKIQVMETGAFIQKTGEGTTPMFVISWTTVTGDADNGMYALFHSKNAGAAGNRSFYKNPEVDILLDKGRTETDASKRPTYYEQAQKILVDDAVWDFLAVSQNVVGVNKRVKGFINIGTGNYNFYTCSLK